MTAPQRPQPIHLDPDPRHVEAVWAMRDRETRDELRAGVRLFGFAGCAAALIPLAILGIALLLVAPRSGPDPTTPSPGASAATGSVGVSARVRVSTSGQGPIGAPHERLDTAASGPDDRHDGGAPRTEIGEPLEVVRGDLPDTATTTRGTATWLCDPPRWTRCTKGYPEGSMVAARGSEIPRSWRGKMVRVWHGKRHVDVRIVDACACKGARIIDLYAVAFRRLAPTSRGEISVRVELLGSGALPPTGTTP